MSTRQRLTMGVIAAVVASWPVAATWFLLMVFLGIGIESLPTPSPPPDLVPVIAAVASLPITSIPGLLAGLVSGQRGRELLRPGVGGTVGALCALLTPIGSVAFFALTLTAIPVGSSVGLLLGARTGADGTTLVPPPPPDAAALAPSTGPAPPPPPVEDPTGPAPGCG